ncbi:hypothetical protein [Amycolatopsis tolypomycina]|uniref:hypothetical protein n=1 Tax=Amycolatopsis tolypomycina TaxID=208445 RepID=UPI0033B0B293
MNQADQYVGWVFTGERIAVTVGQRTHALPDGLAEHVLEEGYDLPGDDPATDLIGFEAELRRTLSYAVRRLERCTAALGRQEDMLAYLDAELAAAPSGNHLHRVVAAAHGNASALLRALIQERADAEASVEHWGLHVAEIRDFVSGLGLRSGPLADVARGWTRGWDMPEQVTRFAGEREFLDADPRRAVSTQRIALPDADDVTVGWRRDPDDDDDPIGGDPALTGRWEVGYLEATTEIYAVRRGWGGIDEEVWLLSTGIPPGDARQLLDAAQPHRLDPNSLLLVVDIAAKHHRGSGEHPAHLAKGA